MIKKQIILIVLILIVIIFLIIFYFSTTKSILDESKEIVRYCSSSLSFSLSGNGTCELIASISTNNCENKKYELRNDDTKCSGTIESDREVVFCNWQVSSGNYTYNLYIDNELKDFNSITCLEFETSCPTCEPSPTC